MDFYNNTVAAAATSASTYAFDVQQRSAVTLAAYNLAVADVVDLEKLVGTNWIKCYDSGGTQIQLQAAKNNPLTLTSPGRYRLNKGATTNSVSLHLDA